MADTTYNGWTNWETWQINLWLDNEEPLYRRKVSFLRSVVAPIADLGVTDALIGYVQRWCESVFPDGTPDMRGDEKETVKVQWARVNWTEIAEHFVAEVKEY